MRHGILAPGGVGGLIGAVLADAGEEVTLIVRPGTETLYPREILLESPFRNLRATVGVTAHPEEPLDLLWVAVKATQLESAVKQILGHAEVAMVVPLLNGIDHIAWLRGEFGQEQVIPATIAVESERVAPGKIVHRSPFIRLGVLENEKSRLVPILEIFRRFGFECLFVQDEPTLLWSKLVFLAPVALSTAAARSSIGEVLADSARAALLETSVAEACAVAIRSGAKVDAEAVLARIKSLPPNMRSSMERDIANGNAPELDAIAGPILRRAKKFEITLKAIPALFEAVSQSAHPSANSGAAARWARPID
jgi:2-dehydropantoate 2-reductase